MKKLLAFLGFSFCCACTKTNVPVSENKTFLNTTTTEKYKLGDTVGEGIVFYIDSTGKHGLIFGLHDLGTGRTVWSPHFITTGATGIAIGTGKSNTQKIIDAVGPTGHYAALLCAKYKGGGYKNWFLPSRDEMKEVYNHKELFATFPFDHPFWTSTERTREDAFNTDLFVFGQSPILKPERVFVRPMRSF